MYTYYTSIWQMQFTVFRILHFITLSIIIYYSISNNITHAELESPRFMLSIRRPSVVTTVITVSTRLYFYFMITFSLFTWLDHIINTPRVKYTLVYYYCCATEWSRAQLDRIVLDYIVVIILLYNISVHTHLYIYRFIL